MSSHRAAPLGLALAALTSALGCGEAFGNAGAGGSGAAGATSSSGDGGGSGGASAASTTSSAGGAGGATVGVSSSAGTGGNCESPSCGACSDPVLAGLKDDFEDGATAAIWTPFADNGTTVKELLGELQIVTAIGFSPPKNAGYYSSSIAALHECAVSVKLLSPAGIGDAAGYVTFFHMRSTASLTFAGFAVHDGQLAYEVISDGTPVDVGGDRYSPDQHRYLRLREEAGQLHWDVSPNGVEWDERKKVLTPTFLASSRLYVGAGVTQDLQTPSTARFDDVNITP